MFGDIAFHTEGLRLHGCCKTLPSFIILVHGANHAVTLTYRLPCLYSVGVFFRGVSTSVGRFWSYGETLWISES